MKDDMAGECEIRIKRLAGIYQMGDDYQQTKAAINSTLADFNHRLGKDVSVRIMVWSELHASLKNSLIISADSRWIEAIRYAISRVKTFKQNAMASHAAWVASHA
ncbi:hypothetical protein PRCB_01400 [Pantoea rodasii]|uniref:Uncharacterized protein n=1 Tax=Pantoea rodasii TaxID=1076549 RepID=A0A2M9WIJ8_9GAMM|nr:hypothetical protein [Pantoea rodasii]ORM64218.1 hypothetical protein HA45_10300 [Pantoea rodasii]PJZ07347.1 hypothetical protein PRCB_01400 [Pantoea rodasii]